MKLLGILSFFMLIFAFLSKCFGAKESEVDILVPLFALSLDVSGIKGWGLYYKTFYGHNLRISEINQGFVLGKPFQPSLMFAVKAGAYLTEAPFRCSTLGQAPDLTHKHQTRLERLAKQEPTLRKESQGSYTLVGSILACKYQTMVLVTSSLLS